MDKRVTERYRVSKMSLDSKRDRLSHKQLNDMLNYINVIRVKKSTPETPNTNKKLELLNIKLQLTSKDKNLFKTILLNYHKIELILIDTLESLITLLENLLFLLNFLEKSSKWTNFIDKLTLKISKIWMVLTVKISVHRYWQLTKLETAMVVTGNYDKIISKLKFYTIINFGLCLVEIIELLNLKQFSWLIRIYNVYRMVGNGSLCLEDDEEASIQLLFKEYDV